MRTPHSRRYSVFFLAYVHARDKMKRLCFLAPDVAHARTAVAALRTAGVGDANLMVLARHDIPLEELPRAGIDATDALPGFARGIAVGGVMGAIAGIAVLSIEELGLAFGGAAIPLLTLLGASVSGFISLLGGASLPSSRLREFQDAVERNGKILLMVDVTDDRVDEFVNLMKTSNPDTEFVGVEPHARNVPK